MSGGSMAAKIVLTIGKRKLEFTPEEAKQVQSQLAEILNPPAPKPPAETFAESIRRAQALELERLKKENREHIRRRNERPQWDRMPPVPYPYDQPPRWLRWPEITCQAGQQTSGTMILNPSRS
jgi:hypothetical protein